MQFPARWKRRRCRRRLPLAALVTLFLTTACVSQEQEVRTAFESYRHAVQAHDSSALRELMAREKAAALDAPDAEMMLEFLAQATPRHTEILDVEVGVQRAEVVLRGELDGQVMDGTARLVLEDGRWKMLEESWRIDFTSSFEIASRLGARSAQPLEVGLYVPAHDGDVTQLAFTPDGRFLVSIGYNDFYLRVWDLGSEELTFEIELDERPRDMAITPDGQYVVVGDADGNVTLWPFATGELGSPERLTGAVQHLTQLAVSHDGALVATTAWEGPAEVWDLQTRKRVKRLDASISHRGVDFSPTDPWVICGGHDNTFSIWDLEAERGGRKTLEVPKVGEQSDVWCIAVSPDGRYVATGHMDSSISIWDLARRKQLHNWYVRDASTHAALFSPDGAVLTTAQQNGRVYFWDPETGRRISELTGHEGAVKSLAFNAAGDYIFASGGEDGQIIVYQ